MIVAYKTVVEMSKDNKQKRPHLRILVADDMWVTVQSIRLMLRLLPDVEIVADAKDGQQAIDMMREHMPDIALVDINMPKLDGFSVVKNMLEFNPDMVCIMMSVEGDESVVKAKEYGASDYLIKPFTTEELIVAVDRAGQIMLNRKPETRDTGILRRKLATAPLRCGQTSELKAKREAYLEQLARQYIKERRTSDEVIVVFEELVSRPYCEIHWLKWLAIIYVKRMQWGKLKILSERLEQMNGFD
jgi:YesN/AraC family two-component response regulator